MQHTLIMGTIFTHYKAMNTYFYDVTLILLSYYLKFIYRSSQKKWPQARLRDRLIGPGSPL